MSVIEQLYQILDGVSNKETIICGLMLPNSPLYVFEQDNEDDEHVTIEFDAFRGRGTFTDAIVDLARTYNDDTNNITLLRCFELYHWGGFLAVPIEWTEKIKVFVNIMWLECLKEKLITIRTIASYERLMDDELTPLCPLPIKYFNCLCKNTEFYWQCCNINDCKHIIDYTKKNPTIKQHIWYTTKCEEYDWCDNEPLNNRSCKLTFEKSIKVVSKLIGKDGTRYLPDTVRGDITVRKARAHSAYAFFGCAIDCNDINIDCSDSDADCSDSDTDFYDSDDELFDVIDCKLGDGVTRYLPDTVGGSLKLNNCVNKLGDGVTRYLPDTVGGSLELDNYEDKLGDGVTRYLPDTVGGSTNLIRFKGAIGNGATRYLPDIVGGSLDLRNFNNVIGDGTVRYLPDKVGGSLDLRNFNNVISDGIKLYLPDSVGGLVISKVIQNIRDDAMR